MGKKLIIKNADFSVNAIELELDVTITVDSNNSEYGTVNGSGTYRRGQTITISASANSGYHFVSWDDGNTDAIRTVIVTEDKTNYTAIFEVGESIDVYGVETLYEGSGGGSEHSYRQRTTYNIPALHTGKLKSIRMALSRDVNVHILCGIVDQNGYFICNRTYENVTIKGSKVETDLSAYNIPVNKGEIVVVANSTNENSLIPYAYYIMSGGASNCYYVNDDMSLLNRDDGVKQTFYYKIRY